jgi:hypothetical protein
VITSVTVTNHAPTTKKPTYQLGPNDAVTKVPGEYAGIAYLWAPRGSTTAGGVPESGLVVSSRNLDILPGKSETVTFGTSIPDAVHLGSLAVRWVPQPTVNPQTISVSVTGIGGISVAGPATRASTLTKSVEFSWPISH